MEKMNLFEMQAIAGGISREEYCAELDAIMSDNWGKFTKKESCCKIICAELLSKNLCNSLNIF